MSDMNRIVEDVRILYVYLISNKIEVPKETLGVLRKAFTDPTLTDASGQKPDEFLSAYENIASTLANSMSKIKEEELCASRLSRHVQAVQQLISHASANGKQIDDEVRNKLVEVADAVSRKNVGPADEQAFFKAYQQLTVKLAPVNAATLEASETRLPNWSALFANPRDVFHGKGGITIGRFIHFVVFVAVLLGVGFALAYQSVGEATLARYQNLSKQIIAAQIASDKDLPQSQSGRSAILSAFAKSGSENQTGKGESLDPDVIAALSDPTNLGRLQKELDTLPVALHEWESKPCGSWWTKWMCAFNASPALTAYKSGGPAPLYWVFSAKSALDRMSQIVLPLLLGLLGAYSYVLRSMSREIRELTFAPHSSLQHLVQLSLGALAGIASGWLLKPEEVGLLSSVPAWTLAFVAGYGTDLVFAFMDRIISAFTTKKS